MQSLVVCLLSLLVSASTASAEAPTVSGQVRLLDGSAVVGAQVVLFDVADLRRGALVQATTDADGQFALPLAGFDRLSPQLGGRGLPQGFVLGQNYPNPFNPSTVIPYKLPDGRVMCGLEVFNVLGQRVATLVDGERPAGAHTAVWTATDEVGQAVSAGLYFYRLTAGEATATGRMVLVDGQAGTASMGAAAASLGQADAVNALGAPVVESLAELPVYGLAVFGDGLATYVDSAFVLGSGPVEVVLDGGRGKAVVQEVDEDEVAVRWHFGDLDFSLLDGDNQDVESTVDDDIIDDINDQIKDVCPRNKEEIKFAYQDGFLVSEMDVELYKCITGLDKDQYFSAGEGVKTLRNDGVFFAASTAVKLVAVIAASIGAALAAKLIAIAAAVGYVFTAVSGISDVQYITNASGNIIEEHVSSTRVGFLGNFTTDNQKMIPGGEYIPFLMVKNERKEAKVIPLKLVSSFDFHRGTTTARLGPTARVLGSIMGTIRIQPQKGYVIIPPNTVSLEFNPNEQTFPDHEWDRRVRFWFDTDSWFFSRKLTLDVARGHSYIPEFTAIRGSGPLGNTLFLDASPSVLPDDADAEYRWLYNNYTALVSMDLGRGPQLSVPLSVFEDELVNGLGSVDIQLAVTVGEVRVVKRKLVEIIGTESWNEEPDTPPGELVTGTERVFSLPGGGEMAFVWIEPGVFQMGSDDGHSDERPVHEVEISRGFWLGKYEVTQGEWEAVMGSNLSSNRGDARRPVEDVSWYYVHKFIGKLNAAAGDSLYRLPSEAEWEYACRAGTSTRWSFGDDESQLTDYAWYGGNNRPYGTKAVGEKKANDWGLYDMHGNVWEWVQDWYGSRYYNDSPRVDPLGPTSGVARVFRGGNYASDAQYLRSAIRNRYSPHLYHYVIGVRLLRIYNP